MAFKTRKKLKMGGFPFALKPSKWGDYKELPTWARLGPATGSSSCTAPSLRLLAHAETRAGPNTLLRFWSNLDFTSVVKPFPTGVLVYNYMRGPLWE